MSMNEAQTMAAIAAQQEALSAMYGIPAAPAPAAPAAPYGPTGDPFGKDSEPAHTGKGAQTQTGPEDTPSKGLDLSQLSVEYANPDLGLLGAPGPQTDTIAAGHFGDTGPRPARQQSAPDPQPVFDPNTGKWIDPKTGKPTDPPAPSLFDMYSGGRN
jgi:hypothetical protein